MLLRSSSEDCDQVLLSNHNDDVADEHIVHRGTCLNLPEADPSSDPKAELQTGELLSSSTCDDDHAGGDDHLLIIKWTY